MERPVSLAVRQRLSPWRVVGSLSKLRAFLETLVEAFRSFQINIPIDTTKFVFLNVVFLSYVLKIWAETTGLACLLYLITSLLIRCLLEKNKVYRLHVMHLYVIL